jgi:hypothetical protein
MATKAKRRNPTKAEKAKRKAKFTQKRNFQANVYNNMQQAYYQQIMMKQDIIRRATIVEGILNARPELAVVKEGKLVLNDENVYLNETDNILYWKADNNPIVSGLDAFESYAKYSPEFVNEVLEFISVHKPNNQPSTEVDLGDFDLVEDDSFGVDEEPTNECCDETCESCEDTTDETETKA